MTNHEKLLWETSKVWCPNVGPDYPRRASNATSPQEPVKNRYELVTSLLDASANGKDSFVSTYSFPRGHTDDGNNIPEIDTIFVDFDIPPQSEYREGDSRSLDEWKRSMSDLLIRVQLVADALLESGKAKHWRASLSGHKGVHLFFDFESIHHSNGSYSQFQNGLGEYGKKMIEGLDEIAGGININPWLDVDSSDLARLVRHPNTPHYGAKHVDESWCVPVTIEELSELTADDYLELTSGPRELPEACVRNPSKDATTEISVEYIRTAPGASTTSSNSGGSKKNPAAVDEYQEQSNDKISVSDIPLLVTDKPCIMNFIERDDGFQYGAESRVMEIQIMKELIVKRVPIDVIVNFFRPVDGWDKSTTEKTVVDIISRYDGPMCCTNIWNKAPRFCSAKNGEEGCNIYERAH